MNNIRTLQNFEITESVLNVINNKTKSISPDPDNIYHKILYKTTKIIRKCHHVSND